MRNGDISNIVSSLNVGVRLNGFLVDPKKMNPARRAWSKLGGKLHPSAVDPAAACFVEKLYYRTSFTVDLVYVGKAEADAAKFMDAAAGVPHNRTHLVEDLYGAERLLYGGVLSFYVAAPLDVERMNGEHACTVERFNSMLSKGLNNL